MKEEILPESELILNSDGSVYHLKLREEHITDTIILVGDQGRVGEISKHFDQIDTKIQNREFVSHIGTLKGEPLMALSTGIGTDNIDIVVNELHAAANIDLSKRQFKKEFRALNLIRIGTSGAIQEDIPPGAYVVSEFGLGLDGLIYYYDHSFSDEETKLRGEIISHLNWNQNLPAPYVIKGSEKLINQLGHDMHPGITTTATGFYGPQGRRLAIPLSNPNMNESLRTFDFEGKRISNFEMETSALYALGKMLGHHCCTCCLVLANRANKNNVVNYKESMENLIKTVLDRI